MDGPGEAPNKVPPENENPKFFTGAFDSGITFVQSYGWFLILGAILLLFLKSKLQPHLDRYRKKKEQDAEYYQYDPDVAAKRQESMDAARRRLQERHDADASQFAEKQKEKEEQKRKEKLEDWDRHQQGQGYRSRSRFTNDNQSNDTNKKNKKPPTLRRNDYNPLMGDTRGSSFRPTQSGGGGG